MHQVVELLEKVVEQKLINRNLDQAILQMKIIIIKNTIFMQIVFNQNLLLKMQHIKISFIKKIYQKVDQEKIKAILEKLQKSEFKKKPQQKKVNPKLKQSKPNKNYVENDSDSDEDYKNTKILKTIKKSESSENEEESDVFVLYDKTQKEEFRKIQKELQIKSAGQLKQMLKANDQKQTGNKGELIERIADCMIKGCLEKCPNCSGGRPKLNLIQKIFKCPGYMDDTEFRFCNKVFGPKDLKRIPWVDV